ncbi:hypothetical protein BDD43_3047 [Mucilaginibacter gracilis]|uniref:Transglutaminase superfamily protein n=1 Tax=Mucilaginibacter gracilis TaxID=423350 RepID=A0A495J1K3_9SPHI|nr:hypothetical protein [Mucilaginibacter gracilis]RKR82856.1 hypothetical protein BDD43_3047 [Mucilaginibacter gracilis]
MKYPYLFLIIPLLLGFNANAQKNKQAYRQAFQEQSAMLTGKEPLSFKRSVFLTESAYYSDKLNYQAFCQDISNIAFQLKELIKQKHIERHPTAGNFVTFSFMADTIAANGFKPFTYDFEDFTGTKDWSKQFVTKLLKTHSGNCHSLPFLYKILCEEMGAKAYLALAPNHVYIKHQDERGQWTNVELTNPGFPRDQWIIKEMAITVEAIKKNIYMAPLSPKESVAMTMFDLACGYKSLYGYDQFVLRTANTALKYFPRCVPLIQLKANCLLTMIKAEQKKSKPDSSALLKDIAMHKQTMAYVAALGYKDMPIELYNEWVKSVETEKAKRAANRKN